MRVNVFLSTARRMIGAFIGITATHFPPLSGPTTTPSLEHLGARLTAESLANKLEREAAINQWVKARSTESGGSSSKQSQTPRVMSDTPIASRRPKKGKRGTRGRGPGFKEGAEIFWTSHEFHPKEHNRCSFKKQRSQPNARTICYHIQMATVTTILGFASLKEQAS